jgi:hypothetical protein
MRVLQSGREIETPARGVAVKTLQTDAAINHGSCGGPVHSGEAVGGVLAVHTEGRGIAFAVPATRVRELLKKVRSVKCFSLNLKEVEVMKEFRFRPVLEALENRLTPSGGGPDVWSSTGNTGWYTPGNWSQGVAPNPQNGYQAVFNSTSSVECILPGTENQQACQSRPASLLLDTSFAGMLQVTGESHVTGETVVHSGTIDNHVQSFDCEGALTWDGGQFYNASSAGDLYLRGTLAASRINGGGSVYCGDQIHMDTAGVTLQITGSTHVWFYYNCGINPNASNALLSTSNCTLSEAGTSASVILLTNGGQFAVGPGARCRART